MKPWIVLAIYVIIIHFLFVQGAKLGWWGTDGNGRIHLGD